MLTLTIYFTYFTTVGCLFEIVIQHYVKIKPRAIFHNVNQDLNVGPMKEIYKMQQKSNLKIFSSLYFVVLEQTVCG